MGRGLQTLKQHKLYKSNTQRDRAAPTEKPPCLGDQFPGGTIYPETKGKYPNSSKQREHKIPALKVYNEKTTTHCYNEG